MTEDEAKAWMAARYDASAIAVVERFVTMVVEENDRQNLVSPASIASIWTRHVVDSAQLLVFGKPSGSWLDIGTGGGFPGVIAAILHPGPVTMIEPRRKRVDFLRHCIDVLSLNAEVMLAKVESVDARADIITARAVASIEKLLQAARHCATAGTRWILPRGRLDPADMVMLQRRRIMFHVEQSVTDPVSSILVIEGQP